MLTERTVLHHAGKHPPLVLLVRPAAGDQGLQVVQRQGGGRPAQGPWRQGHLE
jgi:hypothetical protein